MKKKKRELNYKCKFFIRLFTGRGIVGLTEQNCNFSAHPDSPAFDRTD